MKRFPAILVCLFSIPFYTIGLLFLIAATGTPSRALVSLALSAVGTALLVPGLRQLRRAAALSSEALKNGALELARRLGGELTEAQFRAEYRLTEAQALKALAGMVREGICSEDRREGRMVYVFRGLQPSLAEKACPYCGTKLPVRSAGLKCPNCGAQLEIVKT